MDRKFRKISFCGWLCCVMFLLSAQNSAIVEDPIHFSNARISALGGYHAALADDIMTIFNNPAGFHTTPPEFLLSEITLGITGPIFDITGTILNMDTGDMAGITSELVDIIEGIYAGLNLVGPISLAYVGKGLSFGLFNWADISIEPRGGANLSALITDNLLFTGGYCFRIPIKETTLDIGLQLKALFRGTVDSYNSPLELMTTLTANPLSLITGEDFIFSLGGGLDLGILYSIGKRFSVGIVGRNVYTPTMRNNYLSLDEFLAAADPEQEAGIIPLDLSAGIKFAPPLGLLDRYISDFQILFDYTDILDFITHSNTAKHWLLHLSLAIELKLLEKLALRGGLAQGLPCAGIGLDLSFLQINASMFGSELSLFPGMRPAYNLILGFEFKL